MTQPNRAPAVGGRYRRARDSSPDLNRPTPPAPRPVDDLPPPWRHPVEVPAPEPAELIYRVDGAEDLAAVREAMERRRHLPTAAWQYPITIHYTRQVWPRTERLHCLPGDVLADLHGTVGYVVLPNGCPVLCPFRAVRGHVGRSRSDLLHLAFEQAYRLVEGVCAGMGPAAEAAVTPVVRQLADIAWMWATLRGWRLATAGPLPPTSREVEMLRAQREARRLGGELDRIRAAQQRRTDNAARRGNRGGRDGVVVEFLDDDGDVVEGPTLDEVIGRQLRAQTALHDPANRPAPRQAPAPPPAAAPDRPGRRNIEILEGL
jgi:hypothetical protein